MGTHAVEKQVAKLETEKRELQAQLRRAAERLNQRKEPLDNFDESLRIPHLREAAARKLPVLKREAEDAQKEYQIEEAAIRAKIQTIDEELGRIQNFGLRG
jgi:peptidoglycan hydrolase CwlO-like protein